MRRRIDISTQELKIKLYTSIGSLSRTLTKLVSLTLVKERYTPFYTLDFSFFTDDTMYTYICDISKIQLLYGNTSIFYGRTGQLKLTKESGRLILKGNAISYTKTLATSDAVPGMMLNCKLADIAAANAQMPSVTYQNVSDSASYIYVKESDTIWDAITALSIKLYENYPYITGENTVKIKKLGQAALSYTSDTVREVFTGENFSNAVSKIYMQGTGGEYDYSLEDSEAIRRGIIRERYIPLDRQWLGSPTLGMKHKMLFSRRGGIYYGFTYAGFKNEQLCDNLSFSCSGLSYSGEVSKLILRADKKGIFTTILSYNDGYTRITQ